MVCVLSVFEHLMLSIHYMKYIKGDIEYVCTLEFCSFILSGLNLDFRANQIKTSTGTPKDKYSSVFFIL